MRRATVFVSGVVAGATGATYATRKVKRTVKRTVQNTTEQLKPTNVVKTVGRSVRSGAGHVVDAVRDGRAAMREREDELRGRRDGTVSGLDERLAPGETVYVDGQRVDADRVVVRNGPERRRHRGRRR